MLASKQCGSTKFSMHKNLKVLVLKDNKVEQML